MSGRASEHARDVGRPPRPEADAGQLERFAADRRRASAASLSTAKPLRVSAAGMSRSSSWLPRMAKTPCGACSGASSSATGPTNARSPKVT